jgi:hypothetical protein
VRGKEMGLNLSLAVYLFRTFSESSSVEPMFGSEHKKEGEREREKERVRERGRDEREGEGDERDERGCHTNQA